MTENGDRIACLVTDAGEEFEFDLYVDCSGFRSVLLEKALGSKFISYASSLFTDSALVGVAPHDGHINPYPLAPKPFVWRETAEEIVEKVGRARLALANAPTA